MSSDEECLICFENITYDTVQVLDCNHLFHKNCVINWYNVSTQKDCPICRTVITTINDNDIDNDIDNNSEIVRNIRFNELFFSCQRNSLLLFIPANIFISIFSLIYNVNTIITSTNIILDCISYIGTYTLDLNTLYVYLILWFCKLTSILIYSIYEIYNRIGLFTKNDLVINHLLLFSISEIISMYICIMVTELIGKINYYRRNYLNNV